MTENDQRSLTAQQKAKAALEAAVAVRPIEEIAQECGVDPTEVRQWERELIQKAASLFGDDNLPTACNEADRQHIIIDAPFTTSPHPYLVLASNLTIVSANNLALQTTMQSNEEIVGRHIFDLFPHDPRDPNSSGMGAGKPLQREGLETQLTELNAKQMQVNEALVLKIFECQRIEEALQQSKNRLQQLLAHQEQVKEEERKRIAREIHDDLGQNLMTLKMDISRLHARTAHSHPRLHEGVSVVLSNLDATIKSVRSIINDLRPFELELGLQAAVAWQLKRFERISGVACQLTIDETTFDYALGAKQILAIFRVLQESLSNIARHAHATKAEVALSRTDRTFLMRIKDNGVGTDANDRRKANSFGIVGIRERVSSLGGELFIDSSSDNGTVLSICIPFEEGE